MDGTNSMPDPAPKVPVDRSDAYEAFWQCVDADDAPVSPDSDAARRSAYEQFWDLLDAD
jgi:hypothetical protein